MWPTKNLEHIVHAEFNMEKERKNYFCPCFGIQNESTEFVILDLKGPSQDKLQTKLWFQVIVSGKRNLPWFILIDIFEKNSDRKLSFMRKTFILLRYLSIKKVFYTRCKTFHKNKTWPTIFISLWKLAIFWMALNLAPSTNNQDRGETTTTTATRFAYYFHNLFSFRLIKMALFLYRNHLFLGETHS